MRIRRCQSRSLARALPPGESIRSTTARTESSFSSRARTRPSERSVIPSAPESAGDVPPHRDAPRRPHERDRRGRAFAGKDANNLADVVAFCGGSAPEAHVVPHRPGRLTRFFARLVLVADLVDQLQGLRARGRVGTVLDRRRSHVAPRAADSRDPRLAHATERALERRLRLVAGTVARERLLGALELAHLQDVDVDVELVGEELVQINDFRRDADRLDLARRRQVNLRARARRRVERRVAEAVSVAVDRLAVLADGLQAFSDLGQRGRTPSTLRRSGRRRPSASRSAPISAMRLTSWSKVPCRFAIANRLPDSTSGAPSETSRTTRAGPERRSDVGSVASVFGRPSHATNASGRRARTGRKLTAAPRAGRSERSRGA